MYWLAVPSVVAASALLATGCAKGRDDARKPKSSGSNRAGAVSNKQKQSGKSSRNPGSSSKSSRRDPHKKSSKSGAAARKSNRSKREGRSSKSGKSAKGSSKSTKPVDPKKKDQKAAGALAVAKPAKSGDPKSSSSKRRSEKDKLKKDKSVEGSQRGKDKSKRSSSKRSNRYKRSNRSSRSKESKKESVVLPIDKTQTLSAEDPAKDPKKTAISPVAVSVTKLELAPVEGVAKQELRIEPSELRWKSTGGIQHVAVYNHSNSKKAVKVKCSDNILYRVNPVHAFIPAGGSIRVDILRQNGTAKVDKIVIVAADAGKDDSVPRDVLNRSNATNTDMMVLPLIATAAN